MNIRGQGPGDLAAQRTPSEFEPTAIRRASIQERGFPPLSPQDIPARAEVDTTVVSELFPDRRDVVKAFVLDTGNPYVASLRAKLTDVRDDAAVDVIVNHIARNPFTTLASVLAGDSRGRRQLCGEGAVALQIGGSGGMTWSGTARSAEGRSER